MEETCGEQIRSLSHRLKEVILSLSDSFLLHNRRELHHWTNFFKRYLLKIETTPSKERNSNIFLCTIQINTSIGVGLNRVPLLKAFLNSFLSQLNRHDANFISKSITWSFAKYFLHLFYMNNKHILSYMNNDISLKTIIWSQQISARYLNKNNFRWTFCKNQITLFNYIKLYHFSTDQLGFC